MNEEFLQLLLPLAKFAPEYRYINDSEGYRTLQYKISRFLHWARLPLIFLDVLFLAHNTLEECAVRRPSPDFPICPDIQTFLSSKKYVWYCNEYRHVHAILSPDDKVLLNKLQDAGRSSCVAVDCTRLPGLLGSDLSNNLMVAIMGDLTILPQRVPTVLYFASKDGFDGAEDGYVYAIPESQDKPYWLRVRDLVHTIGPCILAVIYEWRQKHDQWTLRDEHLESMAIQAKQTMQLRGKKREDE